MSSRRPGRQASPTDLASPVPLDPPVPGDPAAPLETTARLLGLLRNGDTSARERLLDRYLPVLRAWARGRLPPLARDLAETDDLVQITLIRALNRLETFEPRREGAFLAYLRTILLNALREQIRRARRRGPGISLDEEVIDPAAVRRGSELDTMLAYEEALATLPEIHKEAVILRLELGFSYAEIAAAIESPSPDAARMLVKRALLELARVMRDEGERESEAADSEE